MHQPRRHRTPFALVASVVFSAACTLAALSGASAQEVGKTIAGVEIKSDKTDVELAEDLVTRIRGNIDINVDDAYDPAAVERARQSVLAMGDFTDVAVVERQEGGPGKVVLVFTVTKRLRIAEIEIVGAKYVSPDVVADAIQTADVRVGDEYDPRRIASARRNIMTLGYYTEVNAGTEETPMGIRVRFTVQEKERIQQIRFVGNSVITDEELMEQMVLRPNVIADTITIRADMARIQSFYRKRGYDAFVQNTRLEYGELEVLISERRVRRIEVNGLKKTRSYVVTREMRIKEGDLFNQHEVASDLRRVLNLQLFETLAWDLRDDPTDPEHYVILVVNVTEKQTGMVMTGGGWSSLEGLIGRVSVSDNNLFGTAKKGSLLAEFGGRTSFMASYTDPWLDEERTSVSVSAFDIERRRQFLGGQFVSSSSGTFDERRSGGSLTVGRPIARNVDVLLGVRVEDVSEAFFTTSRILGDVDVGDFPNAVLSTADSGARQTGDTVPPGGAPGPIIIGAPLHQGGDLRSLTLTAINDRRDLYDNPTGGYWLGGTAEVAGSLLGGATDFRKFSGDARYYKKISDSKERVLAVRLKAGTTTGDLPVFESFIVGGADSLRGYEEDRFWGRNMFLVNAEVREPITDSLTAVAFVDAGSAWEGDFKTGLPGFTIDAPDDDLTVHASVGAGVRIKTPFGPLRFDWGQGEEGGRFHFGFGHLF